MTIQQIAECFDTDRLTKASGVNITLLTAPYAPMSILIATSATPNVLPAAIDAVDTGTGIRRVYVLEQWNVGFTEGMRIRASVVGAEHNYVEGVCMAMNYAANALTIAVDLCGGSGAHGYWVLQLVGQQGQRGPEGPLGDQGPPGSPGGPPGPQGMQGQKGDPGATIYDEWTQSIDQLKADWPYGPWSYGDSFIIHNPDDYSTWGQLWAFKWEGTGPYADTGVPPLGTPVEDLPGELWSTGEWYTYGRLVGPRGLQGPRGAPGGPPGPEGPEGPVGPAGYQGYPGDAGPVGPSIPQTEINTIVGGMVVDANYVYRSGTQNFTGIARGVTPAANSDDASIPTTNWVRGRINEIIANYVPVAGGNTNWLTIGGLPVVRSWTGNQVYLYWVGDGWVHMSVDASYQGGLWHTNNFNPGNYWSIWNFDPNTKANTWDVNAWAGNKANYWDCIYSMRMVYAGQGGPADLGWHHNPREPFGGAVATGGAGLFGVFIPSGGPNAIWGIRLRYLQMMYGHGHWVTVGYA